MGAYLGLYWVLLIWQVGFLYFANFYFETNINSSIYKGHSGLLVLQCIWEKNYFHLMQLNKRSLLCFCSPSWKLKLLTVFGYICLKTILRTTEGVMERLEIMTNEIVRFLLSCIRMGQAERVRWSCHTKYLTRPMLHAQEHNLTKYIPKEH